MSRGAPRRILIATHNPGKVREIVAILSAGEAATHVTWCSLDDLSAPIAEPPEDGATFAENAAHKALYYARASGLWTLADDSGLEVDALDGAPGVHSARYAAPDEVAALTADLPATGRARQDAANNRKLIAALRGCPESAWIARFRCTLALADGERVRLTAEGSIEGRIIAEPRGAGGFGYDPHFLVPHLGRTTAELPLAEKNAISHRGVALKRLRQALAAL